VKRFEMILNSSELMDSSAPNIPNYFTAENPETVNNDQENKNPTLQTLIDHQQQMQQWLLLVNNKIFEMETSYLEDCVSGNLLKGWDIDGRTLPVHRSRSTTDDKDRLFSFSSYSYWLEKKNSLDNVLDKTPTAPAPKINPNYPKTLKKHKKRKMDYDDWNGTEDY
jgi:hypothetical protein